MDEWTGIPNSTPPAAQPGGRPPITGGPTVPAQVPPQDVAAQRVPAYMQPAPVQPSDVPDWQALADRNERAQRRGRLLRIGGVTAALVCVIGLGAAAVTLTRSGSKQHGDRQPTGTSSTGPLSTATLFTATHLVVDGQTFTRAATDTDVPCGNGTTGGLGNILAPHGCRQLLRATYVSGRNAVTVGVAVFDTSQQAAAVMPKYQGEIQSLVRGSVSSFCVDVSCPLTHASVGRYDYFTVAGTTDNRAATGNTLDVAAGQALATYAYDRLTARG